MYGLIKLANEHEEIDNKKQLAEAVGAGVGVGVMTPKAAPRLAGVQRVYHGTSVDNAKKIKEEGLLRSKGGANGATFPESGNVEKSLGKIHLTAQKGVGNYHANFHDIPKEKLFIKNMTPSGQEELMKAPKNGIGTVLSGFLPYEKYNQMELDPVYNKHTLELINRDESNLPNFFKRKFRDVASRGEIDMLPIEFDGAGHSLKERLRYYGGHFPEYVKNHPGRFTSGAAALGAGLVGGSYVGHLASDLENE